MKKDVKIAIITGIFGVIAGAVGGTTLLNMSQVNNVNTVSVLIDGSEIAVSVQEFQNLINKKDYKIDELQNSNSHLKDMYNDLEKKYQNLDNDYLALNNNYEKLDNDYKLLQENYVKLIEENNSTKINNLDEKSYDNKDDLDDDGFMLLSQLDYLYESDKRYKTFNKEKDNYGNDHYDVICGGMNRTYYVNKEFSKIEGVFFHLYKNRSSDMYGEFTIYGDDIVLYTQEGLEVGWKPIDFSVDISNVDKLQVILKADNGVAGIGYYAGLSEVKLFKK